MENRLSSIRPESVNVIGRAQGTLGPKTSSQLVEAAMTALVRQAAMKF